jgi:hypothetical protein
VYPRRNIVLVGRLTFGGKDNEFKSRQAFRGLGEPSR